MTSAMDAPRSPETTETDRIVLTIPGSPALRGVASLVLGGVGSRLDLPYERIDELQLAVLSVLGSSDVESATIEVEIEDARVLVSVGPLPAGALSEPGLQTILERLVDGVDSSQRAEQDGNPDWITLSVARQPPAG
jgi:hypothetical protein